MRTFQPTIVLSRPKQGKTIIIKKEISYRIGKETFESSKVLFDMSMVLYRLISPFTYLLLGNL